MKAILALLLAAGLTGCVVAPHSASVYSGRQTQNEQSVRMGTVDSVREVSIANGSTGTGTMAGAALGGLAGSGVGGGKGAVAATIAGAVVGGIIGSNIEADANKRRGVEITVRLDNGDLTAVTQEADEAFRVGERVRLLSSGRTTRVTH
jgi:outer membrane lipoprotein SlyB